MPLLQIKHLKSVVLQLYIIIIAPMLYFFLILDNWVHLSGVFLESSDWDIQKDKVKINKIIAS